MSTPGPQPFLQAERVHLRAVETEDLPALTRWMNDSEVTQFLLSGRSPVSLQAEVEWLARTRQNASERVFAIGTNGGAPLLGICGLHDIQWIDRLATLGIFLGEKDSWGHGLGSEALRLLVRYGFDQLNLHRLELSVYPTNERAIRAYRRLGFVEEGRLVRRRFRQGQYVDEMWMALLRENEK